MKQESENSRDPQEVFVQFVDMVLTGFPLALQRFTFAYRGTEDGVVVEALLIGRRGGFYWTIGKTDNIEEKADEALDELQKSEYWLRPGDQIAVWTTSFYRRLVQLRPGFYTTFGVSVEAADATLRTLEVTAVTVDRAQHASELYPYQMSPDAAASNFSQRI